MIEKNLPWLGATYFILTLMAWVVFGSAGGHIVHAASFDEITRRKTSALAILTEKSLPSVVSISVAKNIENERSSGKTTPLGKTKPSKKSAIKALGSGFIIDKTGIIVTNHHVIAQTLDQSRVKSNTKPNDLAQFIDVTLANHQKYRATLIGSDELADLALLKIEAKTALPFLRIGNSDLVKVGDWVMAVGNPFGLDGTVTVGIISARRSYKESGGETDLLQTDAPIDHGNSGGPMLNMAGEVVGINSSIFANEKGESVRIGFAIASNDAQPILANLRQFGRFKRGSLGLSLQRLEPELVSNYIPNAKPTHGVLVSLVESQGAAAKAGLLSGDVISQFQGRMVTDPDELVRAIRHSPVGQNIVLEIWRQKQNHSVKILVSELPKEQESTPEMAMHERNDEENDDDDEADSENQDDQQGYDQGGDQENDGEDDNIRDSRPDQASSHPPRPII